MQNVDGNSKSEGGLDDRSVLNLQILVVEILMTTNSIHNSLRVISFRMGHLPRKSHHHYLHV